MIRKLFFTFFLFGLFASSVYGQDSLAYKSKFQFRIMGGANIPIIKLTQGTPLDDLLLYNDYTYYWQLFSFSYFFSKHWGIEINLHGATSEGLAKRPNNFHESMKSEYSDKYYVHSFSTDYNYSENVLTGSVPRCYLSAVYRWETNKFYLYPKLSIGMTWITIDKNSVELKEKNSNNEYKVSFSSQKRINTYLTFAHSVSTGYKIFKWFYVNADVTLSYFKTNIEFKKDFQNLYSKESTLEYFDYKKDVLTLSLGIGLIFAL